MRRLADIIDIRAWAEEKRAEKPVDQAEVVDVREQADVYRTARANGCAPVWSEHFRAWCCGCDDNLHGCDQQCSMITPRSAARKH